MKKFIADTLVKWFKNIPIAGGFRFKLLYWAYRLTGWHIRHREWDFVLDYLPPLGKWQKVRLLDVGCARNLFCFEVDKRGYELHGVDLERPVNKFPGVFYQRDIRETSFGNYDFVTCISVFEHIEDRQPRALENMLYSLKIGGRLLLTIPSKEFAQGHGWEGFDLVKLEGMLPTNCMILEYTERMGQLCLSIQRVS